MAARRRPIKSRTPLDDIQKRLSEEEENLEKKSAKLKRFIEEAPRIAAARQKAQREALLVDRSTRAHHRLNSTTLADTRFEEFGGSAPRRGRRRPLKSEQRQARLIFFGLLAALAVVMVLLFAVWQRLWPG